MSLYVAGHRGVTVAKERADAQTELPVSPNKTPPEGGGCYKLRIS